MKPAEYLKEKLETCSNHALTEQDKKIIQNDGLANFIFKKVCSKDFRKWKVDENTSLQISSAINKKLSNNQPLEFTFGFGGYKLWRLSSSPEVDWAEFFTIAYYSQYLAPIVAAYKPGVNLTFADDEAILEQMNNTPTEDTERYYHSFKFLLNHFVQYFPSNFFINIFRVKDLYGKDYPKALAENLIKVSKNFQKLNREKIMGLTKQAELNIQWNGIDNWTNLPEDKREEKIKQSIVLHVAHCSLSKKIDFINGKDKICISATRGNGSVALGTTKSSTAKFWTGFGVLEKREDKFYDIILTAPQLEKTKGQKYITEKINLIPLKNLQEINIYNKK